MPKPLLVIVSGPPCTGKTTIGKRLAGDLGLSFVNKDGIKELLFDTLGWSDREWSRKLGIASYALLYYFLEAQLSAGRSLVVESNFHPDAANGRFLKLKEEYGFEPVQVLCRTDGMVLYERFMHRAESGERHPGHVDDLNFEEMKPALVRGGDPPLDIGGTVLEVDTTVFESVNYGGIVRAIMASSPSWPGQSGGESDAGRG